MLASCPCMVIAAYACSLPEARKVLFLPALDCGWLGQDWLSHVLMHCSMPSQACTRHAEAKHNTCEQAAPWSWDGSA